MISAFQNWAGRIEINGISYDSVDAAKTEFKPSMDVVHIKLLPRNRQSVISSGIAAQFRVTVKQYMTKPASPEFDFMAKWNHNVPMPLRTMTGTKEKETRGMVYMKLHGDMWAEKICTCMKCGRALTNPVSQYFGIGPECGGHNYVNPFNSEEELKAAVDSYKKELRAITWEGWIIKSAITEEVEVDVA